MTKYLIAIAFMIILTLATVYSSIAYGKICAVNDYSVSNPGSGGYICACTGFHFSTFDLGSGNANYLVFTYEIEDRRSAKSSTNVLYEWSPISGIKWIGFTATAIG